MSIIGTLQFYLHDLTTLLSHICSNTIIIISLLKLHIINFPKNVYLIKQFFIL